MLKHCNKAIFIIGLFLFFAVPVIAQQDTTDTGNDSQPDTVNMKGFHLGLQAGTYFANKYTCNLYDGYGIDMYGNRNDFIHSFMYQSIVNYYGGGNGQTDRIALALGVNPGQWSFNEVDMPINLKYNVAL